MLDKINVLRERLEQQVLEDESYDVILKTSQQIDKLLVEYYESMKLAENLALVK